MLQSGSAADHLMRKSMWMKFSLGTWRNPHTRRPGYSWVDLTTSLSARESSVAEHDHCERFLEWFEGNFVMEVMNKPTRGDGLFGPTTQTQGRTGWRQPSLRDYKTVALEVRSQEFWQAELQLWPSEEQGLPLGGEEYKCVVQIESGSKNFRKWHKIHPSVCCQWKRWDYQLCTYKYLKPSIWCFHQALINLVLVFYCFT